MIFFFVVAGLTFLIPAGLVAAELTASYTEHSGIYGWVKQAFGSASVFCDLVAVDQYVGMVSNDTGIIAGSIAYSIDPQLTRISTY